MGAYPHLYYGVYMLVPYGKKTVTETITVNPKTGKKMNTPFDPATGEKGESKTITKTEEKYPSPYDFMSNLKINGMREDHFVIGEYDGCDDNAKAWMLNNYSKYHLKFGESLGDRAPFQIDLADKTLIPEEGLLESFKVDYAPVIAKVKEEFGEPVIRFGFIYYLH